MKINYRTRVNNADLELITKTTDYKKNKVEISGFNNTKPNYLKS